MTKVYSERLSTREIPQADTLDNVSDVVEFVSRGYDTYQLIAKKLGLTERQGRYYRLAAELLGFIENIPHRNASRLTGLGKEFLQATKDKKQDIMFAQIFKVPIVQSIIGILASSDCSAIDRSVRCFRSVFLKSSVHAEDVEVVLNCVVLKFGNPDVWLGAL